MNKLLSETVITNACKLGICAVAAATLDPTALAMAGLAITPKEVFSSLLSIGGNLTASHLKSSSETNQAHKDFFNAVKYTFENEARFDLSSDVRVSNEVADFFGQAILDLNFEAEDFRRFSDGFEHDAGIYTGMAEQILKTVQNCDLKLPTDDHKTLAKNILSIAIKSSVQAKNTHNELFVSLFEKIIRINKEGHETTQEMLSQLIIAVKSSGFFEKARSVDVSEAAVRAYLEKALENRFSEGNILSWLPEWIERASIVFRSVGNDDIAFQRALQEADNLFDSKRMSEASQPMMDDLARLETEESDLAQEFHRRKILRIETAIYLDELAQNYAGIFDKVMKWAEIEGAGFGEQLVAFVGTKGVEYMVQGQSATGPSRLLMAKSVFEGLTKSEILNDHEFHYLTLMNLANCCGILGERIDGKAGEELYLEALELYELCIHFFDKKDTAYEWVQANINMGNIYKNISERHLSNKKINYLNLSILKFTKALEICSPDNIGYLWAMANNNLGNSFRLIFEDNKDFKNINYVLKSIEHLKKSSSYFLSENLLNDFAMSQTYLAKSYILILSSGFCGNVNGVIKYAKICLSNALSIRKKEKYSYYWAEVQESIADLHNICFDISKNSEDIVLALNSIKGALEIYKEGKAEFRLKACDSLINQLESKFASLNQ